LRLMELAVGAAFAATVIVLRDDPAELALGLVLVAMLAAVTLTDLERRVIPNVVLLAGAVAAVAIVAATDPASFPERGIAAAAAGGGLFPVPPPHPPRVGVGGGELAGGRGRFPRRARPPVPP